MKEAVFTIIRAVRYQENPEDYDDPIRFTYTGIYRNGERIHHSYGDLADHELLSYCLGYLVKKVEVMEFHPKDELEEEEIFPEALDVLQGRISLVQIEESE